MKFIKPSEIASKVMTLFDESDEFVLIVSPYVKILRWYKLLKKLENLKRRKIKHSFIIRDDFSGNSNSFKELDELGIDFTAIPDLHCKLYMNEKYVIVSSMNLLLSSEINSIELAYQTETKEEYQELITFCERYLGVDFTPEKQPAKKVGPGLYTFDWTNLAREILQHSLNRNIKTKKEKNSFIINTGKNNYSGFVWNSNQNFLRIFGILTAKECQYLVTNPQIIPKIEGIRMEFFDGKNNHDNTIWGTLEQPLVSRDLIELMPEEAQLIANSFANFVEAVEIFKNLE